MTTKDWDGRLPDYPASAVRRYRDAGLWGERTIAQEFHAVALRYPGREAVVSQEGRLTFAELDRRTDQVAAGLCDLGLGPGDPILFQVTNRLHSIVAWYGALKAGLIPVATLAAHRRHEISQVAIRTGAAAHLVEAGTGGFDLVTFAREHQADSPAIRHILTAGAAEPAPGLTRLEDLGTGVDPAAARRLVEEVQAALDADDVAVFQLSGGTTGVPKVIARRHAEYWYNARAYAARLGWDEQSRVAHLIPIIHNAGIVCGVHAPHSAGACLLLGTPDAEASLPLLIEREGHRHPGRARPLPGDRRSWHHGPGRLGPAPGAVRHEGSARAVRRDRGARRVVGAAVRDGGGLHGAHRDRRAPGSAADHGRHAAVGPGRVPHPAPRQRGGTPGRRHGRAVLPGPVHAARVLRRRRAQPGRVHDRRVLPHRRPGHGGHGRAAPGTCPSTAGSRT